MGDVICNLKVTERTEIVSFDLEHILEMTAGSTGLHESATHLDFSSTLVKGIVLSESDGTFTGFALDVDR